MPKSMLLYCAILFCLGGVFCSLYSDQDQVHNLPGVNFEVTFKHYAGYLNGSENDRIFYWFTESQNDPSTDPLVLWLNGGPGCSSVDGLLTENGPFRVQDDSDVIYENVFAWNKMANVLYIESPSGVGFSYALDGNISATDDSTAKINHNALLSFFAKFPQYVTRDLYLTGESYAGYYIPTLSVLLLDDTEHFKHFKGVAIGNPFVGEETNFNSVLLFYYYHGLIDDTVWNSIQSECKCTYEIDCGYLDFYIANGGSLCNQLIDNVTDLVYQGNDPYNLYWQCYSDGKTLQKRSTRSSKKWAYIPQLFKKHYSKEIETVATNIESQKVCMENNFTAVYLNQESVKAALHVTAPRGTVWESCNNDLNEYLYKPTYDNMTSQFNRMLSSSLRILIYNGDTDMVCNFLGDQWFVQRLGQKMLQSKQPWFYNDISAGYVTRYEKIDQLTVRGSGHFVPGDKPREALQMITNFIRNDDYTKKTGISIVPSKLTGGVSWGRAHFWVNGFCLLLLANCLKIVEY